MNTDVISGPRWAARLDARKISGDYSESLRCVAAYYDMYDRGYKFLSPWINRSFNSTGMCIPPSKEAIASAIGKPRSCIHPAVSVAFIDSLYLFACKSKGKRQLISPDPTTHHSGQFPSGTFSLKERDNTTEVSIFGCAEPFIVDRLQFPVDHVSFIIVRPKLGKLGTTSAIKWEILFFKQNHGYLIDHCDSNLNPRFAGIM